MAVVLAYGFKKPICGQRKLHHTNMEMERLSNSGVWLTPHLLVRRNIFEISIPAFSIACLEKIVLSLSIRLLVTKVQLFFLCMVLVLSWNISATISIV